jgi:fermentation-respiration switch protein FrsA (DUF1100 family)
LVIRFIAYAVIAYLSIGLFFYFRQATLLYPAPKIFEKRTGECESSSACVVDSRGNSIGQSDSCVPRQRLRLEDMVGDETTRLHRTGANLMLVDYRGYGSSTPIRPNEKTINEDAQAAFDYLLRERKTPCDKVFVLGRSIGSGPATYLAANNRRLGGLILESPFSSIDDAAAGFWYLRVYPVALMLRTHFDNVTKIESVGTPVLIVSGTADMLTPTWMAEKKSSPEHASQSSSIFFPAPGITTSRSSEGLSWIRCCGCSSLTGAIHRVN